MGLTAKFNLISLFAIVGLVSCIILGRPGPKPVSNIPYIVAKQRYDLQAPLKLAHPVEVPPHATKELKQALRTLNRSIEDYNRRQAEVQMKYLKLLDEIEKEVRKEEHD